MDGVQSNIFSVYEATKAETLSGLQVVARVASGGSHRMLSIASQTGTVSSGQSLQFQLPAGMGAGFLVGGSAYIRLTVNVTQTNAGVPAYSWYFKSTGTTMSCRGDNQNGHFPPKCSVRTAAIRSTDPSIARWTITGRSNPSAAVLYSKLKRMGSWKSNCTVAH